MLQKLRDKTSGWIASLILGLLIIPFAFVGVNEYVTGGTAGDVALVEAPPTWWESAPQWWPVSTLWQREEITQEDFRTAFEQARQQQRQAMGEAFDPREFESADNKRKVLEQLIDQKVLALGARRAGVVVGDAAVQKMIASEPAFQIDGKFSPQQYQLLLSSQVPAISPLQFEEQQRERLRMMLVPQAISESDFVTEGEQARMWKVLGETRDIGIALLPPVAEDAAPVTDAPEDPAADGPHQEAGGEHAGRVEQLHGGIGLGEEGRGEIDRAEGVDVEVEPLDQVAGRGGHDGQDALALFLGRVVRVGGGGGIGLGRAEHGRGILAPPTRSAIADCGRAASCEPLFAEAQRRWRSGSGCWCRTGLRPRAYAARFIRNRCLGEKAARG